MLLSKLPMLILAFAMLARVAPAQAAPTVTDFKLDNGLEVVVIPDHRAPVVTHMIWYKVGAADETPGKSGLAHFLEHLMFKGTEKNPGDAFSQDVAEIGGQENAFTTSDYTGFFQRVPREHLKEMMALEADRITGLDTIVKDAAALKFTATELTKAQLDDLIQQGTKMLDDWVPALVFGDAVIIDGFTKQVKGCDRKDRVTLFDDNRFDTCWLDR